MRHKSTFTLLLVRQIQRIHAHLGIRTRRLPLTQKSWIDDQCTLDHLLHSQYTSPEMAKIDGEL